MPALAGVALAAGKPDGAGKDVAGLQAAPGRDQFVKTYCVGCHSARAKTGGVMLEGISSADPSAHADVWEKVIRRLNADEMPPHAIKRRPDRAASRAVAAGLERDLDAAAAKAPYAGRTAIRRLNRTEYGNAVRDLLNIDFAYGEALPSDNVAAGFDNIADALSMSPLLLESYLKVARRVADQALGTGEVSLVTDTFPATRTQAAWQGEGMPFGTRGGVRIRKYFPRDGVYDLRAFLNDADLTPTEGVRFFHMRVPVTEGEHTFIVTFPDQHGVSEGPVPNLPGAGGRALGGPVDARGSVVQPTLMFMLDGRKLKQFAIAGPNAGEAVSIEAGPPTLARAEITGPYDAGPPRQTASRAAALICQPKTAAQEQPCVRKILAQLLRRAWRRDVTAQDAAPFVASFEQARKTAGFDKAVAVALRDVLVSPDFLFRLEFDPAKVKPEQTFRISDFELASRLSFFLWSSIPDDRLLDLAAAGRLHNPKVLDGEVRRMLAEPRADALIDNFAQQWLSLRDADTALPDPKTYPQFDIAMRESMQTEARLFLRSVMRENRSVMDVVGADYTYLNERLADLYGIDGVRGPGFRRVKLSADSPRGGVMGMGSILMLTSHSNNTSPILRGKWVLTNLLDSPPNPPPAGVPPLNLAPGDNGKVLTTREQVERHVSNPICSTCHARMDPYGFALENFDVIGRWRDRDQGGPIDAGTVTAGGDALTGITGLRAVLAQNPELFVNAVTSRMMTYALGRPVETRDMPQLRAIVRKASPGWKFDDIILGIVHSTPFQMRQAAGGQS